MANKSRDRGTLGTTSLILVRIRGDSGPLDFILLFFWNIRLVDPGHGINNSSNKIPMNHLQRNFVGLSRQLRSELDISKQILQSLVYWNTAKRKFVSFRFTFYLVKWKYNKTIKYKIM